MERQAPPPPLFYPWPGCMQATDLSPPQIPPHPHTNLLELVLLECPSFLFFFSAPPLSPPHPSTPPYTHTPPLPPLHPPHRLLCLCSCVCGCPPPPQPSPRSASSSLQPQPDPISRPGLCVSAPRYALAHLCLDHHTHTSCGHVPPRPSASQPPHPSLPSRQRKRKRRRRVCASLSPVQPKPLSLSRTTPPRVWFSPVPSQRVPIVHF